MINKLHFYQSDVPLGLITCFDAPGGGNLKFIKSIRDEGILLPLSLFIYKDGLFQVCNGGTRFNILKYVLKKPSDYKVPCLLVSVFDWSHKPIKKESFFFQFFFNITIIHLIIRSKRSSSVRVAKH